MLASFAKITESSRPPGKKKVNQKFILLKDAVFRKVTTTPGMLYRKKTKQTKQNKTNQTKKYIQNYSTQKIQKQPKKNKQENHACGAFEISLRVYS